MYILKLYTINDLSLLIVRVCMCIDFFSILSSISVVLNASVLLQSNQIMTKTYIVGKEEKPTLQLIKRQR